MSTTIQLFPFDPLCMWRFAKLLLESELGVMRAIGLRSWLRAVGLEDLRSESFFNDVQAPPSETEFGYLSGFLRGCVPEAEKMDLSEADVDKWRALIDVDSSDHRLNHPDLFYRESHMLTLGKKPRAG